MLLYFHSSAKGSMCIGAKQSTNSATELRRLMSSNPRFSKTISRVQDLGVYLSTWEEACPGRSLSRAYQGTTRMCGSPLPPAFVSFARKPICVRQMGAAECLARSPDDRGTETLGYPAGLFGCSMRALKSLCCFGLLLKSVGCYRRWWTDENLGWFKRFLW